MTWIKSLAELERCLNGGGVFFLGAVLAIEAFVFWYFSNIISDTICDVVFKGGIALMVGNMLWIAKEHETITLIEKNDVFAVSGAIILVSGVGFVFFWITDGFTIKKPDLITQPASNWLLLLLLSIGFFVETSCLV